MSAYRKPLPYDKPQPYDGTAAVLTPSDRNAVTIAAGWEPQTSRSITSAAEFVDAPPHASVVRAMSDVIVTHAGERPHR